MIYSFDADIFIASWRTYYRPSSFPGLWDCVARLIDTGRLKCAEPVYDEIQRGDDELSRWIKSRQDQVVYPWDVKIQRAILRIQGHPNPWYRQLVNPNGESGADPWVIALALVSGATVVTFEKKVWSNAKSPKIPNVCEEFGVDCVSFFEVIAREQWEFS